MPITKVVVSGSFRKYWKYITGVVNDFSASGLKVLAPKIDGVSGRKETFVILSSDDPTKSPEKLELDFMSEISKADFLYVVDIKGYIGISVAAEIAYARLHNIPVIVAEPVKMFAHTVSETARTAVLRAIVDQLGYYAIVRRQSQRQH
jgi:hypothetical protein